MCGIVGFLARPEEHSSEHLTTVAGTMADVLATRGPDDSGVWSDVDSGVALGHRRLAILDLSEQGHQPMLSACGRYVLVYNGEIYNFKEIRAELKELKVRFRGTSDTEVLLAAISHWGLRDTLPKLRGMFAFALWSRKERKLTLVRDRIGIKPLYYGQAGNEFVFASELKAFHQHPRFKKEVNPSAVALLMRHNYIPAPYSIYQGVKKLQPGMLLEIPLGETTEESCDQPIGSNCEPEAYWTLQEAIANGKTNRFTGSYEEAVDQLDILLKQAVDYRMLSDVPLGAFLSGGVDSSLIVAMMQKKHSQPIRTFTIGFTEHEYDEAPFAHRISDYIGTAHTELCVTPSEARNIIPHLPEIYDEPFADMSQIPTCLVSKLAREYVTVSLSGDGGDELFGGYHRYFHLDNIWNKLQKIPARKWTSSVLDNLTSRVPHSILPELLQKLTFAARIESTEELYAQLHRHWSPEEIMAQETFDPSFELGFGAPNPDLDLAKLKWMALDTTTYLPDDILTKVDRASMSVSLEARVPLLDHHIVEFAWTLPQHYRYQGDSGKRILRSLLERYIPADMFDRPKVGFGIPIGEWLRGSLRDWAEDLLSEKSLNEHGLLNNAIIRSRWQEHCSGKQNSQYLLWDVLVFQQWYRATMST